MRVLSFAALAATLSLAPLSAVAAPTSMLHTLPRGGEQPAATQAEAPRASWFSKWFRGDSPEPVVVTPPAYGAPNQAPDQASAAMAYTPPQDAPRANYGAFNAQHGATPSAPSGLGHYGPGNPAGTLNAPQAPGVTPLEPGAPLSRVAPTAGRPTTPDASSDAKSLRDQGHAKDRTGELAAAERLYRQAIGVDPTSAAAVNDLGLCLARQGKLEQSAAVLRQAITMRPDKQLYRNNIATVLVELGKPDEALGHLKTVAAPAAAHFNVGQLLSRAGETEASIENLRKALELDPALTPAREALSKLEAAERPETVTPDYVAYEPAPATAPTPAPSAPAYGATAPGQASAPTAPIYGYRPTQVASAPQRAEPQPAEPTLANPAEEEESAAPPSFPRLLPPVMNR